MNTRSALYGEAIFTSFRSFGVKVPKLSSHFKRLYAAAEDYYELSHISYEQFVAHFLGEFKPESFGENQYFRLDLYNTSSARLIQNDIGLSDLELKITNRDIVESNSDEMISLKSYLSPYGKGFIPYKSASYFQNLLYRKKAMRVGSDDALFFLDEKITEATTSNIIFQKGSQFYTPKGDHFLKGITLELFKEKFNIEETNIFLREMDHYDSAYLLNSVKSIVPVFQLDHFQFKINRNIPKEFKQFLEQSV